MAETSKRPKSPARSSKRKAVVRDLEEKDADSVKGGVKTAESTSEPVRGEAQDKDHKGWTDISR